MASDDTVPIGPPADPEEWSDEQWIAWLRATDGEGAAGAQEESEGPVSLGSRIVRTSGGSILGQSMLALGHIIYGRQDDEIVVVAEGPSDVEPEDAIELHLDPEHPERSTALFRRRRGGPGS